MIILEIIIFLLGLGIVLGTVFSAIETFVLPRSAPDPLTRLVFVSLRHLFTLRLKFLPKYLDRDRLMAFYAPIGLLMLVPTWYALVSVGYTGMYWATGTTNWYQAWLLSGSSLLTLGFATPDQPIQLPLVFSEAILGLILVALLIAYLPTMYSAFSRREAAVTLLEVRAGSPPSAVEMLVRYNGIHGLSQLNKLWQDWENWFADIEESHTSLPALVFFRSPQPEHSWVTSAGAVLDAASLTLSAVDIPEDPQAQLCIRAGYLALRHISDFFSIPYNPDPQFPSDPISVSRLEFDQACERLAAQGVPVKADRDKAWLGFAGWRVNYDRVLLALAGIAMAPSAPWSTDRAQDNFTPPIFRSKKG